MKKLLIWALVLSSIMYVSCAKSEEGNEDKQGSIYGIVTKLGTAEPMKAVGVELYKRGALLLKTVTFDDGHFEFKNLNPENYQVKVVAEGFVQTEEGLVTVEAGRQARIDLQVKKPDTHLLIRTTDVTEHGSYVTLNCEYTNETGYAPYEVGFVYGTSQSVSLDDGTIVKCEVTPSFSITLTNLNPGQYYFRAYVKNSIGIVYGDICSFSIFNVVVIDNLMIQTEDLGCVSWIDAVTLCKDSRVAGYSDWRLPTLDELKIMYRSRSKIPNLDTSQNAFSAYWSSDFADNNMAYCFDFGRGSEGSNWVDFSRNNVRAVRTIN